MKIYLLLIILVLAHFSFGQKKINVYLNRTTSLIFSESIKHVALGSDEGIGYLTDDSIPHILEFRINEFFPKIGSTNALVITMDEQIFSFEIVFQNKVTQTTYPIADSLAICPKIPKLSFNPKNDLYRESLHQKIITSPQYMSRILFHKKGKVKIQINNIFTDDSLLYFHCQLINLSNLMYDIDFIHLSITDTKPLKSKTIQDTALPLTFLKKKSDRISPNNFLDLIFHTPKYTLEKDKICILECYEQKGGRHLKIRFNNNVILEATDLKTILNN